MRKKRAKTKIIRLRADQLSPISAEELDRLERRMGQPVDTSDIPTRQFTRRPFSPIRKAIIEEMHQQGITGYRLWKLSHAYLPRIPESAVYEFLANKRSVRVDYADAMLQALGLRLTASRSRRAG